MILSTQY